jgi:hypothetical protein
MRKTPSRKRPCRICRRWFLPDPRLKGRQMTCGDAHCKRQWHRKKCQEWNLKNKDYFRSNYLHKKLDALSRDEQATQTLPPESTTLVPLKSRLNSGLPLTYVQEVIGIKHLIIIEYLSQLLVRRFQEALRGQPTVTIGKLSRLPGVVVSRGDGL